MRSLTFSPIGGSIKGEFTVSTHNIISNVLTCYVITIKYVCTTKHTLTIFLNYSSLMFMSSTGSRRGTPSGNRRITSWLDLPTLNQLSASRRSLGRYSRTLLIFVMRLSNTGRACSEKSLHRSIQRITNRGTNQIY